MNKSVPCRISFCSAREDESEVCHWNLGQIYGFRNKLGQRSNSAVFVDFPHFKRILPHTSIIYVYLIAYRCVQLEKANPESVNGI